MSQKPVPEKLLIRDNYRVLLVNEPEGYRSILGRLPQKVTVMTQGAKDVDLIQVFVTSKKELENQLVKLKPILSEKGLLWVTYSKEIQDSMDAFGTVHSPRNLWHWHGR